MTTFAPGTNRDYANAYNNWFWNGGYARGEPAPRRQDFGPDSNGLMPRPPADPYAGLEDLRDMYPGVSPDELRRLRDRMEEARRGDAADRYRQDMERYAPQYERNARAENQRLEEEMRRRQQQPQTPPVERRDPREWRDGRLAPPGSPVGVYPRQPIGGRPPDSGPPRLQPLPAPRVAPQPDSYDRRAGMGDMASWASQQAAQAALPGRQITQYGPGSFGSAAGEPGGSSRQLFRQGMAQPVQPQSQGTPYGAPSPWGGAPSRQPMPGGARRPF